MAGVEPSLPGGRGGGAGPSGAWKRPLFGRAEWVHPSPSPEEVAALSERYPEVVVVPETAWADAAASWSAVGVVARSLGRWVSVETVARELRVRAGLAGEVSGASIDNGFMVFRMQSEHDRELVLARPWVVAGQAVAVERWRPGFFPVGEAVSSALVWVRLPHLPVELWGAEALRAILRPVGELVALDECTAARKRLGFARVSLRLDLSSPLRPGTLVQGPAGPFWQLFVFEGIGGVCCSCGRFHATECCREEGPESGVRGASSSSPSASSSTSAFVLGPWSVASRQWRPGVVRKEAASGPAVQPEGPKVMSPSVPPSRRPGKEAASGPQVAGWSTPAKVARRRSPPRRDSGGARSGSSAGGGRFSALAVPDGELTSGGDEGTSGVDAELTGRSARGRRGRGVTGRESACLLPASGRSACGSGRAGVEGPSVGRPRGLVGLARSAGSSGPPGPGSLALVGGPAAVPGPAGCGPGLPVSGPGLAVSGPVVLPGPAVEPGSGVGRGPAEGVGSALGVGLEVGFGLAGGPGSVGVGAAAGVGPGVGVGLGSGGPSSLVQESVLLPGPGSPPKRARPAEFDASPGLSVCSRGSRRGAGRKGRLPPSPLAPLSVVGSPGLPSPGPVGSPAAPPGVFLFSACGVAGAGPGVAPDPVPVPGALTHDEAFLRLSEVLRGKEVPAPEDGEMVLGDRAICSGEGSMDHPSPSSFTQS